VNRQAGGSLQILVASNGTSIGETSNDATFGMRVPMLYDPVSKRAIYVQRNALSVNALDVTDMSISWSIDYSAVSGNPFTEGYQVAMDSAGRIIVAGSIQGGDATLAIYGA
jgi:hypothetical protein